MGTKFLDGLGDKLAEGWVALILTPAFLFWAGGFLAATDCGSWSLWPHFPRWMRAPVDSRVGPCNSWTLGRAAHQVGQLNTAGLIVLIAGGIVVVVMSGVVVQVFLPKACRWTQGWWSWPPFSWVATYRSGRHYRAAKKCSDQWRVEESLRSKEDKTDDSKVWQRRARQRMREEKLEDVPALLVLDKGGRHWELAEVEYFMPTALGNVMSAGGYATYKKFGLNQAVCWYPLLLVLPDGARNDLLAARRRADDSILIYMWCLFFMVWGVVVWWAVPVGWIAGHIAHHYMVGAGRNYVRISNGTFVAHRRLLYEALRMPLPAKASDEMTSGKVLSRFLLENERAESLTYTGSPDQTPSDVATAATGGSATTDSGSSSCSGQSGRRAAGRRWRWRSGGAWWG